MKFLLLGIIQGLTEFLPVSSDGHLYLLKKILGIPGDLLALFVFLHMATLLAVIIFFWKSICDTLRNGRILLHIFIITIITAALGLTVKHFFDNLFENKYFVALCFLINALVLLSIKSSGKRESKTINFKDSIFLGILQGFAVLPAISRSGFTISGLLKRGFDKDISFKLSFVMAVPAILGAFLLELKDFSGYCRQNVNLSFLALSFLAAFCVGIAALLIVRRSIISDKFKNFGYYCLLMFLLTLFL